jgi:hypothetical protein
MYWIYFILFVLAVFTPEIIRRDIGFIGEERAEQLAILFIGSLGFLIYLSKEKQLYRKTLEKLKIQKEATLISKHLTDSYSYIGEMNRKIDILKNITQGLSEGVNGMSPQKKQEVYKEILHAILLFSKAERAAIAFFDSKKREIIKEIKNSPKMKCFLNNSEILGRKSGLTETKNNFFIKTSKNINGVFACLVIAKKSSQHKLDDPELMEVLMSQALLLFSLGESGENLGAPPKL